MSLGVQIDTNPLNLQNPNTESVRPIAISRATRHLALRAERDGAEPRSRARACAEARGRRRASPACAGSRISCPRDQERRSRDPAASGATRRELFGRPRSAPPPDDAELAAGLRVDQGDAPAIAATPSDARSTRTIISGRQIARRGAGALRGEARRTSRRRCRSSATRLRAAARGSLRTCGAKFSVARAGHARRISPRICARTGWRRTGACGSRVLPAGDIGSPEADERLHRQRAGGGAAGRRRAG